MKIINNHPLLRKVVFVLIGWGVIILLQQIYIRTGPSPFEWMNSKVIGDLGGVPVAIPRIFASLVEYDRDPHFMERKGWTSPERTFQSKLSSFGFDVRYPDMASVNVRTKAEENIRTTMWMRVGVNSGEIYGVDEYLDNHKNYALSSKDRPCYKKCFIYVPLSDKTYGLTGYTPTGSGVDVEKRSINFGRGTDLRDRNVYFFQNDSGRVTTFIKCSNRTHAATRCTQSFNLNPMMKAHISVSYRKALLPNWQQIQQSVTELIHGFKADTTTLTE